MFIFCVFLFMIPSLSASDISLAPNEWSYFNLGDIQYITIDLEEIEGLFHGFNKLNITDLELDFEIKVDDIVNGTSDKIYSDKLERDKANNVYIIIACTATALAASVVMFIVGKKVLIDYLQSGKYELPEDRRDAKGHHEMSQVRS